MREDLVFFLFFQKKLGFFFFGFFWRFVIVFQVVNTFTAALIVALAA